MAKVVKKQMDKPVTNKAELPKITDEIFKMKIDKESQKFFIEGLENYGKFDEVIIRPLDMLNKIVAYTEDFEVKHESTLYSQLKEAKDTMGCSASDKEGKVCGRVVWKNLTEGMSEDELEDNKAKAKFYVMIFGIAYVQGQDPILVDFRVGGKNFMEVINILNKIKEDKNEYNRAEIRVKAYHNDEYDWPELEFMPEFSRELPVTGLEPLLDTVEGYVQYHNEGIDKKAQAYRDKKAGKTSGFKKSTSFKRK